MKDNLFSIDNFNVISDGEYYYVFRALNSGDHRDIEEQKITEDGERLARIRTDRERWEEQNGKASKYAESNEASVEEIISHCKAFDHSKETNCISLTSNANIVLNYGEGYNNEYVMVKIPKSSSEGFIEAGKFLLEDLEKRINEKISELDINSELYGQLERMNSQNKKEIVESVVATFTKVKSEGKYTGKNALKDKVSIHSRFENKQIFSEEQQRKFSEIIGKLTLLELHGKFEPVLNNTRDNSLYLKTMAAIFSNTEILHYNSMESKDFIPVSRSIVDIFALIQQVGDKDRTNEQIKILESKILELAQKGYDVKEKDGKIVLTNGNYDIDISQVDMSKLNVNTFDETQIDIEHIYRLTGGKIPYKKAKEYIEFSHKLGESRQKAQEFSKILSIVFSDDNFEEIINKISSEGFVINKDIIRRHDGKGIQISESVNIDGNKGLKNTLSQQEQEKIVELIRSLSPQELEQLVGQRDVNLSNRLFEVLISSDIEKTENEYYAEAIIDSLDMTKIYRKNTSRDKSLNENERQKILNMLKNADCQKMYNAFLKAGVGRDYISDYIINILADGGYKGFSFEELSQLDNLDEIIKINIQNKNLKGHIYPSTMEALRGIKDNDNIVEGTRMKLRDYQQKTTDNVDRIYVEGKRFAGVVLPTGAGKSFVAMEQMLKKQNGNIIYIAPQQEILSQIQRHILKNVAKVEVLTTDEIEELKKEQNVKNSNQLKLPDGKILPTQAGEYVKKVFPHLKLLCYQGLAEKKDNELDEEEKSERDTEERELREILKNADADLIVFDELHRSGAKTWKNVVQQLITTNSHADILGITATPIRDVDHVDMMRELATMTNTYTEEELNTKQYLGYEMYLTDAIQRGLVVEPKLVSFDFMLRDTDEYQEIIEMIANEKDETKRKELIEIKEQIDSLINGDTEITEHIKNNISQKENEAIGQIIKDTIQKKDGRYIVFLPQHSGSDGLDENEYFKQQEQKIREILKEIDEEPEITRLSSKDSKVENHRAITDFENSTSKHIKIMLAINKLNEGVHVDGINGEIMYRKINDGSTILYLQQLGRVIYSLDPDSPVPEDEIPIVYDIYNNYLVQDLNRTVNQTTPKSDLQKLQEIIDWMDKHDYENLDINSEDINEARKAITLKKIQNKYKKYREGINNPRLSKSDIYEIEQILDLANSIDLFNKDLGERIVPPGEKELSEVQLFKVSATQKNFLELYKKANKVRGNTERHQNRPSAKLNDIMNILATLNSNDIFIDNNLIQYGDKLNDVIAKCPEEFRQILQEELYMYEEDYPIGVEYNFAKASFRDSGVWKYFENSDVKKLYTCGIFENVDENYLNESELSSNKKENLNNPVLSNDFIIGGPKGLKGLNVKTGTYYDENGYDIDGYNINRLKKEFVSIDVAKKLLHKDIITESTTINTDTTIYDLFIQGGYKDSSEIEQICSQLGIDVSDEIGKNIDFLRTAYYTSSRHFENNRMFGLFSNDLYELAQLGIIPNDKIAPSGEILIGTYKGLVIPEYEKVYEKQQIEYKRKEHERIERLQEEKRKKEEEEERKKQEPFDGITTGIKLLQKGIIESGKEIPELATIEDLLKLKGYSEDKDIEEICIELGLDKKEKIGEKLKYLTELYNSGSVRSDNDDGKRFRRFGNNLLEMSQLGIFEVKENGRISRGVFHDQYISSIKKEYDRLQERKKANTEEKERIDKTNYQFKGLNTASILLKIGAIYEGETIFKEYTVNDIFKLRKYSDDKIKMICSKYKINPDEKIGDELDLLKLEYVDPTSIGKQLFIKNKDKVVEMVLLGIIPIESINNGYIKKGPLLNLDLWSDKKRLEEFSEKLEDIKVFMFNKDARMYFKEKVVEIENKLKKLKEFGYTIQNRDFKNAFEMNQANIRLFNTVMAELNKFSAPERKIEFERRKKEAKEYVDGVISHEDIDYSFFDDLRKKISILENMTVQESERKISLEGEEKNRKKEEWIENYKKKKDEVQKRDKEKRKAFEDERERREEEQRKARLQREKKERETKKSDPEEMVKREKQTELFLALKEKAQKLATGEMEMLEYISTSKTTIDELISFAKKQKMSPDVVRGLYKRKTEYASFKQPFKKEEYLSQTTLIIDGKYVKPTEKDVDICITYLKLNGTYICKKTVQETIRSFLKGEIDISIDTEMVENKIKENTKIIAENDELIKDSLIKVVTGQQQIIKSQEIEIQDLKRQRSEIDG